MEKEYTYVLTVGDKVVKPIAVSWWSNEIDEKKLKGAMAATASVLYVKKLSPLGWLN